MFKTDPERKKTTGRWGEHDQKSRWSFTQWTRWRPYPLKFTKT